MSADWQQQMDNERQRREESLYCVYCGNEVANEGRASCCGEVGHVECYEDHLKNWNGVTEILNADPEYPRWVASTYLTHHTGHHSHD